MTEPVRTTVDSEDQPTPIETRMEPAVELPPHDSHNLRLLSNVHPAHHVNPEPQKRYHLVVVGAGTAGLVSAAGAAGLGARVALIERHLMGGDCLNVGCVPSKGVIRPARAWHEARTGSERFAGPEVTGSGDFGAAMERMRRIRADISRHDSVSRFRDELGIDVFLGQGRFTGRNTVEVDGKTLTFRRAVIATGARAAAPPIPGLDPVGYLTNETIFSLTELPDRLAVIGAGPIGCEMAQSFARFGSRVGLFDMADHILVREDADAAQVVQEHVVRDGVELVMGAKILRVETRDSRKVVVYEQGGDEKEWIADQLLVAVGRAPNVDGLGLEEAGVEYDEKHGVEVDEHLRTTNPRIYAAGDISSRYKFTHIADAEARVVIQNALFSIGPLGKKRGDELLVPWCTYTSPEVSHVGMYEKDAKDKGLEVQTITVPLAEVDRAVLDGEADGFARIHLEQGSDRILGATIVAEHSGDMINELTVAIQNGVGLSSLANVIHPYPTQAEVIKKAADAYNRTKLTPTVKKVFGWWFRLTG